MKNKTIACVIARTVSKRLHKKVLSQINDEYNIIEYILERLKKLELVDEIYLCTSDETADDALEGVAQKCGIKSYRGSANSVIDRMLAVGEIENADNLIRITGDNVFTSVEYIDRQIEIQNLNQLDYCRMGKLPLGATPEIIRLSALKHCYETIDPDISEYLLLFMFNPGKYKCGICFANYPDDISRFSLTVDNENDLARTRAIIQNFDGDVLNIKLKDIIELVAKHSLPYVAIADEMPVKLPYNKTIEYHEFENDMNNRINKSQHFQLEY